ncbi:glycine betaine ABC transporter substrate-binding protein [Nocardia acidivorans]|uniref:glycine betaine ABC transporter substrate-binding protein n=1 Tax=Nocardia acidivorans TaxID=404580 RepID=UPI000836E121|nr:glycine betaine ABC transporter substrate-binding protein [Nocardia acidivorans]
MFGSTDSRAPRRALLSTALAVTLALATLACGGDDAPALTLGAGDSTQSRLLAEIYAGALARTGAQTRVRGGLGARSARLAALDADTVVVVADATGDLLTALDSTSTARTPDDVNKALNGALPEGLTVGDPADGTDLRPVVVAAAATALPASLKDLAPLCPELTIGVATGHTLDPMHAPLDPQRDVITPLQSVYGCAVTHAVSFPGAEEARKALSTGEIQLAVLSGPASYLPDGGTDLTSLADPAYLFRAAMVLPVLRKAALSDTQLRKLNYVAGELTTTDLADMLRQIRDNQADPADLARAWLDAHAL